ncbi:expressed unknown protein [Seminavis robusta]|uniref:Uncharacterized protein n=1 Tax=Seminavis robusta TaxID=568900 RepID=A0A9N8DYU1_9STRA|nr:expressed unknown protein [Seminavis robusta]|eukprot:Sro386_g131800.1 n/a (243) ;mRNA; f:3186-3914
MKTVAALVLALFASTASAFLPQKGGSAAAAAKSQIADEAIAAFAKKFPFDRKPIETSPMVTAFLNAGVPTTDIDGTKYKVNKPGEKRGKRLSDIGEKEARATFAELARLYGDESALAMTQSLPVCLTFDRTQFAPSLKEYSAIFGEEEAKAMVTRNAGLLAIRPNEASKATDSTMQASYVIGATRPFGDILLPGLAFLLLVPALEGITGIPIRTEFLSAVTGASPEDVATVFTKVATPVWKQ